MNARSIPRAGLQAWLWFVRLPLTTAETVLGRGNGDSSTWPPSLAFARFEADVKAAVGTVWRDEELVEEGRTGRVRVEELRRAGRLEAEAEARRNEADAEYQARRQTAEQQREETARAARERAEEAEQRRDEERRAAEEEADQRAEAAERVEQREQDELGRRRRTVRGANVAEERAALAEERRALEAEAEASDVDAALKAAKERRRRS